MNTYQVRSPFHYRGDSRVSGRCVVEPWEIVGMFGTLMFVVVGLEMGIADVAGL